MKEEIKDYIYYNRRDFMNAPLNKEVLAPDPFSQFNIWFEQALKSEVLDPYAFVLATADETGMPSARAVYMREISPSGLSFFTNYNSNKGRELAENPRFCADFYWGELSRQIRLWGFSEKLSAEVSDAYFASRPRESRVGAWASDQSKVIENRSVLEDRYKAYAEKYADREVPRPPHWGGFLLRPVRVEFWQGRPSRLHDRFVYEQNEHETWNIDRLSP